MLGSTIPASGRAQRRTSAALTTAIGALVALAACEGPASPSPTTAAAASAAPRSSVTVVAPAVTPGPVRPAGVPSNAEPLLAGCGDAGVTRCADLAPGSYYTAGEWAFLPGLTFTLPAGWSSLSNDAADLELHRTGDDRNEIVVWRDVVPWVDGGAELEGASDPESWIARLAGNPCLDVSEPEQVTLGTWTDLQVDQAGDLQAIGVAVGIAPEGPYEAAGCPGDGRVEIFTDPIHWDGAFSIGGDEMNEPECPCSSAQRLYFASIGYASHPHLLVVVLQSYGPVGGLDAQMADLRTAAQPILDSFIAPAIVVDN